MPPVPPTLNPKLPYVSLKERDVSFEVLGLIPLETADKFKVVVFASEQDKLKLAIVHPEQLKEGFYRSLQEIGSRINKKVEVYQTDAGSMKEVLKRYAAGPSVPKPVVAPVSVPTPMPVPEIPAPKTQAPPMPTAEPNKKAEITAQVPVPEQDSFWDKSAAQAQIPVAAPTVSPTLRPELSAMVDEAPKIIPIVSRPRLAPPVFRLGKTVSNALLKKIPLDYSRSQRLVCVDYQQPNLYWFLTDVTPIDRLQASVDFIESKNDIQSQIITVDTHEVNELLDYYTAILEKEASLQAITPNIASIPAPVPAPLDPRGVLQRDTQGTLLTTEEAKPGLAGIFQKVAQSFGTEKGVEAAMPIPEPIPAEDTTKPVVAGASAAPRPVVPVFSSIQPSVANPSVEDDGEIGKLLPKPVTSLDELKGYIKKGSIPTVVAALVNFAIHEKASDIHMESYDGEVRIRYRVDGQLVDVMKLPPDIQAPMVSRIKILSRLRLDETRVPQDGRFDVNFEHAQVDLRVSVMPTVHGEKVVMRILDKSKGISSLEELGIEGLAYQNLTLAINKPFGICLATGPTGSGKSTSLYAVLNRIATPNVNVVTLEDPVEYEVKGINQSQIRPKIGYTFAEGLRSVLRQDPNIIMVGEIRDGETATMATQAALTGHLVLSTLHTNDAAGAIPRLTNMGIEPFLITSSLNIAMGQRLVRRICSNCKEPINLPDGVRTQIEKDFDAIEKVSPLDAQRVKRPATFYQGRGCDECRGKGYQGRLGIYEVMAMSDKLEELTIARASGSVIQEQAQSEGMITMYQDGLLKVIAGYTTLDEVLREASNK